MKKLNRRESGVFNKHLSVFVNELETSNISYLGIKDSLEKLVSLNSSLNRLNELACNVELTTSQEKRLERLENEAIKIIEDLGFKGDTQRDPRGDAILVYLPSGKDGESYTIGLE